MQAKPLSENKCKKKCPQCEEKNPSPPPYKFTSKDSLKEAVQAFNANPASAEKKYGPIADWDVSNVSDMSHLFDNLEDFNEHISNWITSGVTTMERMFYVRFTRVPLAPSTALGPSPARCLRRCLPVFLPTPGLHLAPRTVCVCPSLSTRQRAEAFNQPLNFDTSNVKNMNAMFGVHSAICPTLRLQSREFQSSELIRGCIAPDRPPSIVCPPFDLTGRKGNQPAAELRHVPRHDHGEYVLCALRLRVHSDSVEPSLARCIRGRRAPPTSPPHPARTLCPGSYALRSTRQRAKAFNQPLNFNTASVTNTDAMFRVHSAHALRPDSSRACPCTLYARPPRRTDIPATPGPHVPCPASYRHMPPS